MKKSTIFLLLLISAWAYVGTFMLPYAVWTFPLTQNWFMQNGFILFRDIIYHHTDLTLFSLFAISKLLGNTFEMLRITSFFLTLAFSYGIYITIKQIFEKASVIMFGIFLVSFLPLFNNFHMEEMVAAIFTLFSVYFFSKFLDYHRSKFIFLSGILAALGFMGKQVSIVIFFAYSFVILWLVIKRIKFNLLKAIWLFSIGLVVGTAPILIYYLAHNAFLDFLYWNIIFNLTVYPAQKQPSAIGDGIFYGSWLFLSIIPGIILFLKGKVKQEMKPKLLLVIFATIFLSASLLPSFHEYKLLIFYPYPVILWSFVWVYRKHKLLLLFLIIGMISFLPVAKTFYIDYLPQNLLNREYILEYGEDELKVVEWLKKNTREDERIMNLGHHYITTLSKRLPKNKYVYIFPWLVMPYEKSTKEILSDPPRVVIIDNRTFSDWPVLEKEWGFIKYIENNYKRTVSYGTYEIYINQESN